MAEQGSRFTKAWHSRDKRVKSICTEEDIKEDDKHEYKQEQENYDTLGEGDFITFKDSEEGRFQFNFWGSKLDKLGKSAWEAWETNQIKSKTSPIQWDG